MSDKTPKQKLLETVRTWASDCRKAYTEARVKDSEGALDVIVEWDWFAADPRAHQMHVDIYKAQLEMSKAQQRLAEYCRERLKDMK